MRIPRQVLCGVALLAARTVLAADGPFDFRSFKTDGDADRWLRTNSVTYASFVREIESREGVRGYRFVPREDIRRGMAVYAAGVMEIQLNPALAGPDRLTTLIFEMANAARHGDHQQIDRAADEGLIRTPEEFGLAHEMVEFEALRLHRQVLVEIESCAGPLPKEFFFFVTPVPDTIRDYRLPGLYDYLKAQRESGHTRHYHDLFRLRVAGAGK